MVRSKESSTFYLILSLKFYFLKKAKDTVVLMFFVCRQSRRQTSCGCRETVKTTSLRRPCFGAKFQVPLPKLKSFLQKLNNHSVETIFILRYNLNR